MTDARELFGDGVTSKPRYAEPVEAVVWQDDEGGRFVVYLWPQPVIKARRLVDMISNALDKITDPDEAIAALTRVAERLTTAKKRDGKETPAVIARSSGLTLKIFDKLCADGLTYSGGVFDKLRENPTLTFEEELGYQPKLMRHLFVHSAPVAIAIVKHLNEGIERLLAKDEARKNDSGTSSES